MPVEPHIYTLTGNLLAEHTLEYEEWQPGATQRAVRQSFQVGGKGINVSKMLNRLGTANTALCFLGGTTGTDCEAWLQAQAFSYRAFPSSSPTRNGVVVRGAAQPETTFLGVDRPPDAAAVAACADFLDTRPDGQVLAVCGSFPGWQDARYDPLRQCLDRWVARGRLVADTYGSPLSWVSQRPVALIKVNADEARTLPAAVRSNLPPPAERWIVTDGPRPVRLRDVHGSIEQIEPPAIQEVSATGSGDVLLACVVHAMFGQQLPLRDAVAFALPYAAANAAHPGVADFPAPLPIASQHIPGAAALTARKANR